MAELEQIPEVDPAIEAMWRHVLVEGHKHRLSFLPGDRRCMTCAISLAGVSGRLIQIATGLHQSRKNPQVCNLCDDLLPMGGAEVDLAVVFADVRGSTSLAEKMGPTAFVRLLNRFYQAANTALLANQGIIDKMVGDEVFAIYLPCGSPTYRANAVHAAVRLLKLLGYGTPQGGIVPVGIGVHAGNAFCGRIGTDGVHDFTALGDTVNTGARLQAQAQPGEVVISEELYQEVAAEYPNLEARTVELRGKEAPFQIRVLKVG